jgi:glyceraldehyde-3-phosphate dehydrogenase (NAD(P))
MRRANDLSQEGDFIPAPEVGKHEDSRFGTHQGRDAHHLFETMGLDLPIYSSAIKLNTQYMHTIHFNLRLKRSVTMVCASRRRTATHCRAASPRRSVFCIRTASKSS